MRNTTTEPTTPSLSRLPKAGERYPIGGFSRTWLINTNETLPATERFLFRIPAQGKQRGVVIVNVRKLKAFLRRAEQAGVSEGVETNGELVPA